MPKRRKEIKEKKRERKGENERACRKLCNAILIEFGRIYSVVCDKEMYVSTTPSFCVRIWFSWRSLSRIHTHFPYFRLVRRYYSLSSSFNFFSNFLHEFYFYLRTNWYPTFTYAFIIKKDCRKTIQGTLNQEKINDFFLTLWKSKW